MTKKEAEKLKKAIDNLTRYMQSDSPGDVEFVLVDDVYNLIDLITED